jgi:hypothetical protein
MDPRISGILCPILRQDRSGTSAPLALMKKESERELDGPKELLKRLRLNSALDDVRRALFQRKTKIETEPWLQVVECHSFPGRGEICPHILCESLSVKYDNSRDRPCLDVLNC